MMLAALLLAAGAPDKLPPHTGLFAFGSKEAIALASEAAATCQASVQVRRHGDGSVLGFFNIELQPKSRECLEAWFEKNEQLKIKVVIIPDVAGFLFSE